jgi:hypothetical protein
MQRSVKAAIITIALLAALAGTLIFSFTDRLTSDKTQAIEQQNAEQAKQVAQQAAMRAAQMTELKGFITLEVEQFFKDERVIKILNDHNFKANVTRIGSRDMASRVSKESSPDFFMPSGIVAANMIGDAAKKSGFATANYSPYYTPLVIASWQPIAKILASNQMAVNMGNNIYDVDLAKLTATMQAKKRWQDLKDAQGYSVGRSVLVSTTDVRKSNSAAMYLALTSYALNNAEVVTDQTKAKDIALQVSTLFKRQGYQESYVNGNFDDYVGIGMGKTPLAFIYESQLVSYATNRKTIDKEMVLMYPKPTIFNKVMVVTLRDKAKPFAELLSNNEQLQAIATEYGFRTNNAAALPEAATKVGLAIKPRIVDVIDPPSHEIMSSMIEVITEEMKN